MNYHLVYGHLEGLLMFDYNATGDRLHVDRTVYYITKYDLESSLYVRYNQNTACDVITATFCFIRRCRQQQFYRETMHRGGGAAL